MGRSRTLRAAAPAALLLLLPGAAAAWGPTGHRVVGQIAENHLSAAAHYGVQCLIGPESLAEASTWADEIRSDPAWDKAAPWHFISIDDGETLETTERSPRGDVLWAIHHFAGVLRSADASRREKAEALKLLVHFAGDVHQPLHVGRRGDEGGNSVHVTWFGQPTNLHRVWDSAMIDHEQLSFTELARFLDHPTNEQVAAWQASTPEDWVRESFALRSRVYDIGDGSLGYGYSYRELPVVKKRLLQAGVRIAGLLNEIFAPKDEGRDSQ